MGFIKWHKELTVKIIEKLGVGWYAVAWMSWIKGLTTGFIVYHFLLI
tara:strand:+ start:660 stop:800 length:141 start_codon:yes stop_codon:yes gene_type:complete